MLTSVVDRTGHADPDKVREIFLEVERKLAAHDLRIEWPVAIEIVRMPIMGATKSASRQHTLFASLDAVRSDAFDGLLAHESGHMIRTETGHPSHDPAAYRRMSRAIRVPRAGLQVVGGAFNHVQDIYADDLAFLTGFEGRAYDFFRAWVEGNSRTRSRERWANVGRSVTNGFALGNLRRHGLLPAGGPLVETAREFDRRAGFKAVDGFARFFETLPPEPSLGAFVDRVKSLTDSMILAAHSRSL